MNYQETLQWMFEKLPMYQRIGAAAYKADLNNTIHLLELLGQPQCAFKSVHIAGTNGKGSVSHMIAAVFQEAGYKTGLYTSPHLKDFRERIKINGVMITEEAVETFIETYQADFEAMELSFFEMTVGMAFNYFREEKVDIAIVETGMGGRLDSTNLLLPEISVITNIGMDHTQFLGDTITAIAREKAGIIKQGVPVVIGETQAEARAVFEAVAAEKAAPLIFADQIFDANSLNKSDLSMQYLDIWKNSQLYIEELSLPLLGQYQRKNVLTAVCVLDKLAASWKISHNDIRDGLTEVVRLTGLMGRWQLIGRNPLCIADTGHNVDGIREVVQQLAASRFKNLHMVIGMVNDKNIDAMLQLLPGHAVYYFCKADIPRGLDAGILAEKAFQSGLRGEVYHSVWTALQSARNNAGFDDLIFVGGSTFVVAEVV
ncbi:MAG: bifunctional folylpolyglutamate synthase/dihydrofolate synthase [Bacteroidetes bacterium]|nr:bifunctional folylpolyglutamate synthase/dihydrofolate synthase [Bacteroidota bacterium]